MQRLSAFLLFLIASLTLSAQSLVLTEIMYNSPGEDLEFLEFINNSGAPLNLAGYQIIEGVDYTFPNITLEDEETYVITGDSLRFNVVYGSFLSSPAEEWQGSLNNSGERILVVDAALNTVIDVTYDDIAPWPNLGDGFGPSITLCDPDVDNGEPTNWRINRILAESLLLQGAVIFATPNNFIRTTSCVPTSDFWISNNRLVFNIEANDTISIPINRESGSLMETDTVIARFTNNELVAGVDYNIISDTLSYFSGQVSPEFFVIEILDDNVAEAVETGILEIFSLQGLQLNGINPLSTLIIIDNDGPLTNNLELRGILENSEVKALELFVNADMALRDIVNFSLGSANNGNGSDGIEQNLRSIPLASGTCFFITDDTIRFKNFMGLEAGEVRLLEIDNLDFNGNDAVELFEQEELIDVFGFQDIDGEGTAWEYTDGWAKRINGSNNLTFTVDDWSYGGVGSLDVEFNSEAANPYPLECLTTSVKTLEESLAIQIFPNPSSGNFTIQAEDRIKEIRIIDIVGRTIYKDSKIQSNRYDIDLSGSQSGLYFIHCIGDRGEANLRLVIN